MDLRESSGRTCIFRNGTPEVIDGFELSGGELFCKKLFGGYLYTGAFYVCAPGAGEVSDPLHEALSTMPGVEASASAVASGSCAVRVLSSGADRLYWVLNVCRSVARSYLELPPPPWPVW